jgi:carbon-monoxide dehydrogenase medium subunit
MRASPFNYYKARNLEHALDLLARLGEDARPIAGGQSLVPMMNFRLVRPSHLVDINDLPLTEIDVAAATIRIGALVRHAQLLVHPAIARCLPALRQAAAFIAHPTIRKRGTFAGSIAHADPTAELPLITVLYDATIVAVSAAGERRIKAEAFFQGPFATALRPGELITAVEMAMPPTNSSGAFEEFAERQGDFAIAAVGAAFEYHDQTIERARVVWSGADFVPVRAGPVESRLAGRPFRDPDVAETARRFAKTQDPPSDLRASAGYRRALLAELTVRAVASAAARAQA